jgi:hypothetical protein
MEFLEDDTEAASYNASSSLPAIIPSPATLLRPPFPMDETAVRDTMDAVFAAAPLSADLGCPLGIWFKHVRIRCRPWTCDEEVLLSRLMRQVLRNSARYRVNEGVGFLRAPLDPSEVRPPQPPDEPTEGAQRDRRALAGNEHVHMTGSDAQHSTRVPHQPRPPPQPRPRAPPPRVLPEPRPPRLAEARPPPRGPPSMGARIPRPAWLLWEAQIAAHCAVHALNHILQSELPPFSLADLREGAHLARGADIQMEGAPAHLLHPGVLLQREAHEDASGNFTYQAVGRALGRRQFDWRGISPRHDARGDVDPHATVEAAFAPAMTEQGLQPILGIFVHLGDHYTAMVRRAGTIYHMDSLTGVTGGGTYVFTITPELFVDYVRHYATGRRTPGGREIGGLYSVFYVGADMQVDG